MLEIRKDMYNSKVERNRCIPSINESNFIKKNINGSIDIKNSKNKTRQYTNNICYIYSFFISVFLVFILPEKVLLYKSPQNYIILKVNGNGTQKIFSEEYDINEYYPYKIYVNNKVQIMRNKVVKVKDNNQLIKIEWMNNNPNLTFMFSNLMNIETITINNMQSNLSKNFSYMFSNCHNLKSVSFSSIVKVNDINNMFHNCYSLEFINISNFQSITEVNASYLFYNCHNLISFPETANIFPLNDMRFMFYNCFKLYSVNLKKFRIGSSTNMSFLFHNCLNLSHMEFNNDIENQGSLSDMHNLFYNCSSIISISLPFYKSDKDINMSTMFYNCINLKHIEFQNDASYYPIDIHGMFYNCYSLGSLNLGNKIITENTLDMSYLFYNCSSLHLLNFTFLNTMTKNLKGIFQNCKSFISIDLSNFFTPNVEIMWDMFKGCSQLKTLDLKTFDTTKVTDMESMFESCSNLITLSIENFHTPNVQYMNKMFKDCISLTSLNFKNINSNSLGTMYQIFYNCKSLKYLNIYSLVENGQLYEEIFTKTPNDFAFCVKEKENIPNIFELLFNKSNTIRDCSNICYDETRVNISEKKICCPHVKYKDKCYDKCPAKTRVIEKINICEDFNCPNENEYYDYEQNNCITDIQGYYINDTSSKTIDKCHEDCLECITKFTKESSKCTKCKSEKPFIFLGNCFEECIPGFYQRNPDKCKCFNPKCEICSEESLEYDLCETCNEGYYQKENDKTNYNNWINCYKEPENYFLSNGKYKPCFPSCKYCQKEGDYDNQFCLSCNINNSVALLMNDSIDYIYNCYPYCSYYYYFDENKKYQCTNELKCPEGYLFVNGDRRCVKSCSESKKNKYEFRKVCYETCPSEQSFNKNEDYYCGISCPFEAPFELVREQKCVTNCTIMERKDKLCVTNYRGNEVQDKVMANIQEDLITSFDYNYVNENVSVIIEEINNTYEIVTTNKKEELSSTKTSSINLGQCETTLKSYYSIDENEPLYLLKLDAYREGMKNAKVVYYVYYPLSGVKLEQLDLTLCEGDGVSLLLSSNITKNEDYYNLNSDYYNDICCTTTSDDGTDVSLLDRKQNFADNNESLCEEGCVFVKYHYDKDKAECSCKAKTETSLVSEIKINKDVLYNFVNIKKIINFDIMKCFNLLLDRKGIVKNIGLYVFLPTFIMYFICIIIFYKKEYILLRKNINAIIKAKIKLKVILDHEDQEIFNYEVEFFDMIKSKGNLSKHLRYRSIKNKGKKSIYSNIKNKTETDLKNIENTTQLQKNGMKREVKHYCTINTKTDSNRKIFKGDNIYETDKVNNKKQKDKTRKLNLRIKKDENNAPPLKMKRYIKNDGKHSNNELETNGEIDQSIDLDMIWRYKGTFGREERNEIKNILKYNTTELNSMKYREALKYDHRSFLEFYISLLKSKHFIISCFNNQDYNSRIIKIFLCFFSFSSCYAINGLFYDDNTMHKIYEEKGEYNIFSQLPQIVYSNIIGYFLDYILGYLALSEDDTIVIKHVRNIKKIGKKKFEILHNMYNKFIIFFILTFLLLILFWYYIACFCAVYKNTQFHLFKDSIIGFVTSIGIPFATCFVSTIFRIPALKRKTKSNKFIFELSKIIQIF